MLIFIKECDYASYSNNVAKLSKMLNEKDVKAEIDESVIDFFSAAEKKIGLKLDSCKNSSEYASWCRSEEARAIDSHAHYVISQCVSEAKTFFEQLIKICAEDVSYLLSQKCANFYNED